MLKRDEVKGQYQQRRVFRFKQFEVCDDVSAHKVGIDSILCGSWADFNDPKHLLDIGTGCGLLALMMAQRFQSCQCIGIDIDCKYVDEANLNFGNSPWPERLTAECSSLQAYTQINSDIQFAGIISNPPYFRGGLDGTNQARQRARHDAELPREVLFSCVNDLLCKDGAFCLTLPSRDIEYSLSLGRLYGLYADKICTVRAVKSKISKISLLKFTKLECTPRFEELVIGTEMSRTADFESLTHDFYL